MFNTKRTLQDLEDEDDILQEDIEDKAHKNVRTDRDELRLNYDEDSSVSDSSDDSSNEDSNKGQQQEPAKIEEVDDDDDDMFGSDEEVEKPQKPVGKMTFLDEFKNEMADENNGDNDLEDSEVESVDDNSKPKMESFSVDEELKSGLINANGDFVGKQDNSDEEELRDVWYSEHSKKSDISKAKKAEEERELKSRAKMRERAALPIEELLKSMIELLEPLETPMERLKLLNLSRPKGKKKQKLELNTEKEQRRKFEVEQITTLANNLMDKGISDIYDQEREALMRLYRQETGEDLVINRGSKRRHEDAQYEFMYPGDDVVHGPYPKDEILEWKESYFDDDVLVRVVGDIEFTKISVFEFEE